MHRLFAFFLVLALMDLSTSERRDIRGETGSIFNKLNKYVKRNNIHTIPIPDAKLSSQLVTDLRGVTLGDMGSITPVGDCEMWSVDSSTYEAKVTLYMWKMKLSIANLTMISGPAEIAIAALNIEVGLLVNHDDEGTDYSYKYVKLLPRESTIMFLGSPTKEFPEKIVPNDAAVELVQFYNKVFEDKSTMQTSFKKVPYLNELIDKYIFKINKV